MSSVPSVEKTPPRQVPSWDERFLRMVKEVADGSKHPRTQHGAILVKDKRIVATGYNGTPSGFPENAVDWSPGMTWTNRDWTIHAEENALLQAGLDRTAGCCMFVTGAPCPRCLLRIIQCRVERLVYGAAAYSKEDEDKEIYSHIVQLAGGCVLNHPELPNVFVVRFNPGA